MGLSPVPKMSRPTLLLLLHHVDDGAWRVGGWRPRQRHAVVAQVTHQNHVRGHGDEVAS